MFFVSPSAFSQNDKFQGVVTQGVERVRIAVADFKPTTADPNTTALQSTFNQVLFSDLQNAGIFAFISVIAWAVFVALAWDWFGWVKNWNSPFAGWSVAHLSLEFLILAAAINDRRRWDFPFISLISAAAGWFFITDFISNGGAWTYVVTFFVGLAYFLAGTFSHSPSGSRITTTAFPQGWPP